MKNLKEFVPIPGYEGIYEINMEGEIKSLPRNIKYKFKSFFYKGKTLVPNMNMGYKSTSLHKNGKMKTYCIHRLLAITFIPNPEMKRCVNHIDGNKLNNSLSNLEWCTYKENTDHAYSVNLKTTNRKVFCEETGKEWYSISQCAFDIGIHSVVLGRYLSGKAKNKTTIRYK